MITHAGHVMTLANSIIGVGILAMPFCFQKCGIILATLLLIISNWVTRICCHYLIKCSLLTRRKSFEFLGFHAFGSSGKLMVELCIIGYLLGACITYFVVVGDLGPQIVTKILSLESPHLHLRTVIMIAVTLVCILPLGMLKNVDSLSTVCTASIGFYFCLVIKIVLESVEHILANDWTENVVYWRPAGMLQCLPIFSMALSCQMQLFEVFESINNQSLDKLNGIVKNATWICTCVYIAVGFFGYVAFCTQTFSGNILINLSESFGNDAIKIGFVLSVAFSFPLVIFPCRASIYSLLYRKGHADATGYIPETRFKAITVFIVGLALIVALMIPSVELIIGLVGSTIGVAICIMFPAACYRKIVQKDSTERMLAYFILVSGFCLMILGTFANLNAIDAKHSGPHLDVVAMVDVNMVQPAIPSSLTAMKVELVKKNRSQIEAPEAHKMPINIKESLTNVDENKQIIDENKQINDENKEIIEETQFIIDDSKKQMNKIAIKTGGVSITQPPPKLPLNAKQITTEVNKVQNMEQLNLLSDKTDNKKNEKTNEKLLPSISLALNKTVTQLNPIQSINSDAINKDEEIAAEELKNDKIAKSATNEELKKTQNELKKTKELLQRTVGELKEELAKQNKETQDLVVEKLGAVVEKVNQIERNVKQTKSESKSNAKETTKKEEENGNIQIEHQQNMEMIRKNNNNEGTLINLLSERRASLKSPLNGGASGVKTDDVNNSSNKSTLEEHLAIPLPLLLNASSINVKANLKSLEDPKNQANIISQQRTDNLKHKEEEEQLKSMASNLQLRAAKIVQHDEMKHLESKNKNATENMESIRRELLKKNSSYLETQQQQERVKRSNRQIEYRSDFNDIRSVERERKDCLPAIKAEALLAAGVSNAIGFKLRELKATREE